MTVKQIISCVLLVAAISAPAQGSIQVGNAVIPVNLVVRLVESGIINTSLLDTIGTLLVQIANITRFLLSTVWPIFGFKLAAIAVAANLAFWVIKSFTSMILGAGLMFGFCKVTGKCGPWEDVPEERPYPYEALDLAEANLRSATDKFKRLQK